MVSSIWYLYALSIEIGGLTVECILLSDESDAFAAPILLPAAHCALQSSWGSERVEQPGPDIHSHDTGEKKGIGERKIA